MIILLASFSGFRLPQMFNNNIIISDDLECPACTECSDIVHNSSISSESQGTRFSSICPLLPILILEIKSSIAYME